MTTSHLIRLLLVTLFIHIYLKFPLVSRLGIKTYGLWCATKYKCYFGVGLKYNSVGFANKYNFGLKSQTKISNYELQQNHLVAHSLIWCETQCDINQSRPNRFVKLSALPKSHYTNDTIVTHRPSNGGALSMLL